MHSESQNRYSVPILIPFVRYSSPDRKSLGSLGLLVPFIPLPRWDESDYINESTPPTSASDPKFAFSSTDLNSWLVGFFYLGVWALYTKPYSLLGCPQWAVRSDWLRVLCSANVTLPRSRSSLSVFPLFTAARCPTNSPWLSVFTQSTRESCAFPQIQPVISHITTISQARNGMAWQWQWQWQVASVDQSQPPKFECYSKPPNMRGRGLLMCWLWTTVKNDRLFHISQVSQISDRPHYLPVIFGPSCISCITYSPGKWQVQRYMWSHLSPCLYANLRSLSRKKVPSEQLFFLALRSRGTNRVLQHIYPASLPGIIPHPHGVVSTNISSTLSIGCKLIELHHERTSPGTIGSHNGLKNWNTEAWKQITEAAT